MNSKKKLIMLIAVTVVLVIAATAVFAGCAVRDDSNGDMLGIGEQNGGQRFVTGLLVAALGILVVFVLLLLLILLINLFSKLLKGGSILSEKACAYIANLKAIRAEKKANNAKIEAPQNAQQLAIADSAESDDEIAAVIAAVYAVLSSETQAVPMSDLKFKVKSVKRLKSI